MAAFDSTRESFGTARIPWLPALLPPRKSVADVHQDAEGSSIRQLAPLFTRKRDAPEPPDAQCALLSVLVPLTKLMADTKPSTSPASADPVPKPLSAAQPKPKRKRIRLKTDRRREQCRNNQARYRDRQRGFVHDLEQNIQELGKEIQELTKKRHTLCYGVQTKNNVWSVVVEYFRLLRYGFLTRVQTSPTTELQDQELFLRATVHDEVDALIEQWQRYSCCFGSLSLKLLRMEEQPFGAMATSSTLSLTITETTLRNVFPHLVGRTSADDTERHDTYLRIGSRLLGRRLDCQCRVRFSWDDESGRVTRLDATMDLLSPLLRALGSVEDVSYALEQALLTPSYLIRGVQGSGNYHEYKK